MADTPRRTDVFRNIQDAADVQSGGKDGSHGHGHGLNVHARAAAEKPNVVQVS